ncbi:hypothetical protein EJB05_43183, partial [Eragrostis curvula]
MASHHDDALWAKLQELELQLAAYKLLRTARGEDASEGRALWAPEATCRGRQYDAYMRRRDAKREAASAEQRLVAKAKQQTRVAKPMSPRAVRDAQEVCKKTPAVSSIPRSRTATGSPARPHHQRRSSLGAPADFGGDATPRPFLRRGTGTGGAARLRTPRDLPPSSVDVPSTPRPERGHARSVSELPFDTQARARRRWGSPERPPAMFSAADTHRDFSKGLKKLLSFVRKGPSKGDADQPACTGKPVSKGWSGAPACSLLDHRLPMTRTFGISG